MTDTLTTDEIADLQTLLDHKHGRQHTRAEAIAAAVRYWLESHEVTEADTRHDNRSLIPKPEVAITDGDVELEHPERPSFEDIPLGTTRGDDGTIPKR